MALDHEKLKAVILHTCATCEPSRLGAVKLHKVLYFSDMLRYAHVGTPLTGATYRKRPLGPTCDQLLSKLSELRSEGKLDIQTVDYFGYKKKQYIAMTAAETNRLSADELDLLSEVIEFVCESNSAKTISEYSHTRAWEMAAMGEVLEYKSVFHIFPVEISESVKDWAVSEVKKLDNSRREGASLGGKVLGKFRDFILQARSKTRAVLGTA